MTERATTGYNAALKYALEDFGREDPVLKAFQKIAAYLASDTDQKNRLTFGMLRQVAQLQPEDGEILHRTIAYLTGARANLLNVGYEYSVEDFEHVLDADEVGEFLQDGEFSDPRTGMPVPNADEYIYLFFQPNYSAFH